MAQLDTISRARAREERELRARIGLGVKILTNAGYAMIGGTFFKAISEQCEAPALSYVWAGLGLAFLGFAVFFSPLGSAAGE